MQNFVVWIGRKQGQCSLSWQHWVKHAGGDQKALGQQWDWWCCKQHGWKLKEEGGGLKED